MEVLMSLTTYPILSYWDAVEHVLDQVVGGDGSPRSRRQAKRAVDEAYFELTSRRDWRYYYRPLRIYSVASQVDGSIAFDLTGGTYERMVTLTGTTWPSDVEKYNLYVSNVRYEIESRKSSTVITLSERACPTADISSGTSYRLARDTYELPYDFRKMDYLHDVLAPGRLIQVEPGDIMREQRLVRTAALPTMYAIQKTTKFASGLAITFAPVPSTARSFDAIALFRPTAMKVLDYSAIGTVTTTADSTTLTGNSTTFTSEHEGCVIRINKDGDSSVPTSVIGDVQGNRLAPYAMQRVIKTCTSTTSMVMEQAADQTLTASGYRISSRVDIEPGAMQNAFLRLAEAKFAPNDRKGVAERLQMAERAFEFAAWADQRSQLTPGLNFIPNTLADVAASVDPVP